MTWRLGVAGLPIQHSLSPELHEAALRQYGLSGSSTRVEAGLENGDAIRQMMGDRFDALSITMPLKSLARTWCNDVDEIAERLGVVNSICFRDGKLLGINTDGLGFLDAVREHSRVRVDGSHVVVLGSGGAAVSIIDALHHSHVASITVLGRNSAAIQKIAETYDSVRLDALVYRPIDLLVNTTPVTTRDLPTSVLQSVGPHTHVVDITYEPRESPWLKIHRELGCSVQNGVPMLAYQAARQCSWWFGLPVSGSRLLAVL